MTSEPPKARPIRHRIENFVLRGLLGAAGALPWRARLATLGWVVRHAIGPVAGWKRRAERNLERVWPDMPDADRKEIAGRALDNIGRSFAEFYDPEGLRRRVAGLPLEGQGVSALQAALTEGRPVVLASGHYGNYEAPKAALAEMGFPVSMIYRPASNPYFNEHYWATISKMSGRVYAQGAQTQEFFEGAKSGQLSALLFDVRVDGGVVLPFLGHPARTALSVARLARETGAELVPFWGVRATDGVGFRLVFDPPIEHGAEADMMVALTRALEARIAEDPGQWLWSHRRWEDP